MSSELASILCKYPVPDTSGDRILFSIDFFLCIFVSLLARLRENGCRFAWNFQESCGVTNWPWDNLIQFWVNSEKPCDAAVLISLSATLRANRWTDLREIFREGVEWPWDALVTFFGQFQETARCRDAQQGDEVCCAFAPQLVDSYNYCSVWRWVCDDSVDGLWNDKNADGNRAGTITSTQWHRPADNDWPRSVYTDWPTEVNWYWLTEVSWYWLTEVSWYWLTEVNWYWLTEVSW